METLTAFEWIAKVRGASFFYCELYIGNIVELWCNNNVLLNLYNSEQQATQRL